MGSPPPSGGREEVTMRHTARPLRQQPAISALVRRQGPKAARSQTSCITGSTTGSHHLHLLAGLLPLPETPHAIGAVSQHDQPAGQTPAIPGASGLYEIGRLASLFCRSEGAASWRGRSRIPALCTSSELSGKLGKRFCNFGSDASGLVIRRISGNGRFAHPIRFAKSRL